jgi:hypothetical protein
MSKCVTITFRQLVDTEYVAAKGFPYKEDWLSEIRKQSGVSRSSLRAAYDNTVVTDKTKAKLWDWCVAMFPKYRLDIGAMVTTKTRSEARKAG